MLQEGLNLFPDLSAVVYLFMRACVYIICVCICVLMFLCMHTQVFICMYLCKCLSTFTVCVPTLRVGLCSDVD